MKKFAENVVAFLKEEDGPTAVEYAVMLALIIVTCLIAVQSVGDNASAKFQETADILA
ncbi:MULTISPECIES: Flp family type IVb pilin [Pirellulaceae]|uniref:Pilus assembly protein Flp/PilA n=2 Tax=Aporhodopirellula TaxID=3028534 RepID=A0A7W5H7G4_9BACT|nr:MULTISPECIES: Flp family type IVb pilin [Pirellulaceae]EMI43266.1 Flp/Fap pilin component [Rhodopirellula sp. SWK7]MBB3208000.1 pilus assembly protein Flp/PilA [Aporhodopirellula rubra]MCM2372800.1 Flp family type IVb pilin [Aporhodopirellula aestuarii]